MPENGAGTTAAAAGSIGEKVRVVIVSVVESVEVAVAVGDLEGNRQEVGLETGRKLSDIGLCGGFPRVCIDKEF